VWPLIFYALFALACLNLLFSASRVALAAFIGIFVLKGLLEPSIRRGGSVAFMKWFAWIGVIAGVAMYFALDRLALLAFRLMALADQRGGDRVDDVSTALSLLDSPATMLTGVGNAVQRLQGVSYGVEVEPIYLLVNYGIVGAAARYGLLLAIAVAAFKVMRKQGRWESAAGMAAFLAVAGYAVFSLGYFFFQEAYAGVVPWLTFGIVAGIHQRQWREHRIIESHARGSDRAAFVH
jgi:hypothetical protein